jgi:hypothetical protein
MAPIRPPWLRKLLRFGYGAGIVIGADRLEVFLVRVRPGGPAIPGTLRIDNFRERPAAEWGAEYTAFLAAHSASHLCPMAVLPRQEVIVRTLRLPGVNDQDAKAAIGFQMDSLHPFAPEDVAADFARVGTSGVFVVAIAERRVLDYYTELFAEAGVRLSGLTFPGAVYSPAMRIYGEPAATNRLAVAGLEAEAEPPYEIYGESPSHPFYSAQTDGPLERGLALAASEMRLEPDTPVEDLSALFPAWRHAPEELNLAPSARSLAALPYAAALAAACPHLGVPPNLLAPERRASGSRWVYVPTIVLASLLLLLVAASLLQQAIMDRRYAGVLGAEIRRLEPQASLVEAADKQMAETVARIRQLDSFRQRTRADLDLMLEINSMLPPPSWIAGLSIDRGSVTVAGETEQADGLLKKMDASPRLSGSEFMSPIGRSATAEVFRIRSKRDGGGQ